jgi:hypothetical protein
MRVRLALRRAPKKVCCSVCLQSIDNGHHLAMLLQWTQACMPSEASTRAWGCWTKCELSQRGVRKCRRAPPNEQAWNRLNCVILWVFCTRNSWIQCYFQPVFKKKNGGFAIILKLSARLEFGNVIFEQVENHALSSGKYLCPNGGFGNCMWWATLSECCFEQFEKCWVHHNTQNKGLVVRKALKKKSASNFP